MKGTQAFQQGPQEAVAALRGLEGQTYLHFSGTRRVENQEKDKLYDCSSSSSGVFFGHYITKLFSSRGALRVATKYTNIFTGEEEIHPRLGRDINVRYFIVPIPQICPINTCVRDKYLRYALRILQIRNDGPCLERCGPLKCV